MRTFSGDHGKHGDAHRIYAQYSIKNDGRFYLQADSGKQCRVDFANGAYYDSDGRHFKALISEERVITTDANNVALLSFSSGVCIISINGVAGDWLHEFTFGRVGGAVQWYVCSRLGADGYPNRTFTVDVIYYYL